MEHLAQDLTVALEESESCGPIVLEPGQKWGIRRRTRSAGNLQSYIKSGDNQSDGCSSSNTEVRNEGEKAKSPTVHHSDSDDLSLSFSLYNKINYKKQTIRMKNPFDSFIRGRYKKLGMSHSLESDSFNENSPARPSIRRKRKLKRMSVDETPIPPVGKRKRPQRIDILENARSHESNSKIKPLHPSVVDKIEKFCQPLNVSDFDKMETQYTNDNGDIASESSLSWSGGEGHEGDDELTDWAPSQEASSNIDQSSLNESDSREFRAGCRRRLGDERPGFSINTTANEKVAKFLQDTSRNELRLWGADRDKLGQLANLYSLELWFDGPAALLRKTSRTPCMQPTQRHHSLHTGGHKKIRTLDRSVM